MRLCTCLIVFLAMLVSASAAQAAQRYASPTGSGTTCSQAAPCELKEAVKKAQTNDEVIVGAGSYTISEPLFPEAPGAIVNIHGDLSGPMPQISGAVPGTLIVAFTMDSRIAYLDLANSSPGSSAVNCAFGALLERVVARASGEFGSAIRQESTCVVRDSLVIASGTNGTALAAMGGFSTATAIARNVTAIGTGVGSKGVAVSCGFCFPGATQTLDMRNVIAEGVTADLEATGGKAIVGNSNLTLPASPPNSVTDLGGNQTAPPLFVNAGAGNYRPALGSPTVDAGTTDQIGSLDLDGNPRTLGSAPDIGAYEYVPPPPPIPPAGVLQSLSLKPKTFKALNAGGATFSKVKKAKAPVGTTVSYSLSAAGTVSFTVERKTKGRRAGKKCVKQTAKNKAKKACSRYKLVKGGFALNGVTGSNSFKFSGRLNNKALSPGNYRLVGSAGGVTQTAAFKIVR